MLKIQFFVCSIRLGQESILHEQLSECDDSAYTRSDSGGLRICASPLCTEDSPLLYPRFHLLYGCTALMRASMTWCMVDVEMECETSKSPLLPHFEILAWWILWVEGVTWEKVVTWTLIVTLGRVVRGTRQEGAEGDPSSLIGCSRCRSHPRDIAEA